MDTKIQKILKNAAARKAFAVLGIFMVAAALLGASGIGAPKALAGNFAYQSSIKASVINSSLDGTKEQYHFTAQICANGFGTCSLGDDVTQNFQNFIWTISGPNGTNTLSGTTSDFYDPLTNYPSGTYTVTFKATVKPGTYQTQLGAGITDGYQVTSSPGTLTIGIGAIPGYVVKIDDPVIVSGPDSNGAYVYQLSAELDNGVGGPVSGGTGSTPGNAGYSWQWQIKPSTTTGAGIPLTLPNNGIGYSIATPTLAPGQYYISATVSGGNGAQYNSTNLDPNSTLTVGSAGAADVTITPTQSSGFNYQLVGTLSGGQIEQDSQDNPQQITWAWNLNGAALSGNGYSEPATLVTGNNTINVIATDSQNNVVIGTAKGTTTLTVDANGNITATNGTTTTSQDQCSGSLGAGLSCFITRTVGTILQLFVSILFASVWWIISKVLETLLAMQPHTAGFSAVIIQEWVFIRNFSNIFFIATMIIVGIGTILNQEGYSLKKVLPRFVIAALLVNFSLAISQAILGIADTFQSQFLPVAQNSTVIDNLAYDMMNGPLKALTGSNANGFTGTTAILITMLIYFLVALVALCVFVAFTAYLVIRIVALWLLLMTSPLAYSLSVVPIKQFRAAASQWWNLFFRYAFFTPIIALALHICALFAVAQASFVASGANTATASATDTVTQIATNVLSAVLVATCLGASIQIANKLGIWGSEEIGKQFNSAQKKIFSTAPKYLGDVANRGRRNFGNTLTTDSEGNVRTGVKGFAGRLTNAFVVNPDTALKGMTERFEGKNKLAQELASSRESRLSNLRKTGIDNRADVLLMQKKRDEKVSQYMNGFNRKELAQMQAAATKKGDPETQMQILAARGRLGHLRSDAEDEMGRAPSDDELRNYALDSIAGVSAGQKKVFLEQTFDKLGNEKKDLGMIGWGEFAGAGSPIAGTQAQIAAQKEALKSWSPDEMSKVKPGPLAANPDLQKAFTEKVVRGGQEVADSLTKKQIAALNDGDNLSDAVRTMSGPKALQVDSDVVSALPAASKLSVTQALTEKAMSNSAADFADKLSPKALTNFGDHELAQIVSKVTAPEKLDSALLSSANPNTQAAFMARVATQNKIAENATPVQLDQFHGAYRTQLIRAVSAKKAGSLSMAYLRDGAGNVSAANFAAVAQKINTDQNAINSASNDVLSMIQNDYRSGVPSMNYSPTLIQRIDKKLGP